VKNPVGMGKRVRCNSRHLCGFPACPHADEHLPYDIGEKTCMNEMPCRLWQNRVGIGVVKSRCRCVEVGE